MLCAVHRLLTPVSLFFLIIAANKRSSSASSGRVDPCATCAIGKDVVGTVTVRSPEIEGVPPGLLTRRISSCENTTLSTPMKYPSVAAGSSLSTPCGVNGPAPLPTASPRNAVTVSVPLNRSALLTTNAEVFWNVPLANSFTPM